MENIALKCEVLKNSGNFMTREHNKCHLRLFCEIPFQKSIVYSDVVPKKPRQRYKSFFLSITAEK